MHRKQIGIGIAVLLFFVAGILVLMMNRELAQAGNLVIVLDAGHDDSHTGASGNGLREENLNLQIALACKKELETYEGVSVYLVRDKGACPYGGHESVGSSAKCNLKRVEFAQSVGADAYVSIHNNSSDNSSARGVSVYYPNINYNYFCGTTGAGLAQSVLNRLVSAGLHNRGISVRYSEDNTRYPDGSLADYYGVIKNSKLKGFPGIIIEHAFISNASDASAYLNTNEKLQRLGVLDAAGIADYYGLKKKVVLDYSKAFLSASARNHTSEYDIAATGIKGADSVQLAVWSEQGGQDDLKWYEAAHTSDSSWNVTVPINAHATEGIYHVHLYVNHSVFVKATSFTIEGPSADEIRIVGKNHTLGYFTIEALGVKSGTDIDGVSVAVWYRENPNDVKWQELTRETDGIYRTQVDISQFQSQHGEYRVDTYISDKNGIVKCADSQIVTIVNPSFKLEVSEGGAFAVFELKLSGVIEEENVKGVKFLVSHEGGAQVVYEAQRDSFGQWRACVYPAERNMEGRYNVEAYILFEDGNEWFAGETEIMALNKICTIEGSLNEQNQRIWNSEEVQVTADANGPLYQLQIRPWCDYRAVRSALERTDVPHQEFVAYEFEKIPMPSVSGGAVTDVTGDAVTGEAVTGDAVTGDTVTGIAVTSEAVTPEAVESITFVIPEFMRDRELTVLASTGEALVLVPLEMEVSADGSQVTVLADAQGCFVLAADDPRIKGDADMDRKISLRDARMILRAVLQIEPLDPKAEKYCDVDRDGQLTLLDVQTVLKAALKIETNS